MASVVHSREEALAIISKVSADGWREGIAVWNPHRERAVRRELGKRLSFQVWPESLANRAIGAITYLRKKFGAEIGLEYAVLRLETPHPSEEE